MLGREPRRGARLDRAAANAEVEALGRRTGLVVAPDRLVSDLSVGEAQRVEVLKVLWRGAKLLILDEPTAVLSPPEVKDLWVVLRELATEGSTVVLITHKLDEVMEISDTVTVMRAGETVGRMRTTRRVAHVDREDDGRARCGAWPGADKPQATGHRPRAPSHESRVTSHAVLTVENLQASASARRPGSQLRYRIPARSSASPASRATASPSSSRRSRDSAHVSSGSIRIGSRDVSRLSVRERGDAGLSHIPEDRHRRGLVLDYSIADNLILGRQHHFTRRGVLDQACDHRSMASTRCGVRHPAA